MTGSAARTGLSMLFGRCGSVSAAGHSQTAKAASTAARHAASRRRRQYGPINSGNRQRKVAIEHGTLLTGEVGKKVDFPIGL